LEGVATPLFQSSRRGGSITNHQSPITNHQLKPGLGLRPNAALFGYRQDPFLIAIDPMP
jgi:hypothetical protein